jgi:hypothetical protein
MENKLFQQLTIPRHPRTYVFWIERSEILEIVSIWDPSMSISMGPG